MIQKILIALSLLFGSQLAMAQLEPYQEGVHYFKIDQVPAADQPRHGRSYRNLQLCLFALQYL